MKTVVVSLMISVLLLQLEAAQAQEERVFRVLAYGDGDFEGVFFEREDAENQKLKELSFLPNKKSRRYWIPEGQSELHFFRKEFDLKGKERLREVGSVRFNKDNQSFLLVFLELTDFDQVGHYQILLLDESQPFWTAGCFRFLNLSGAELQCRLGDRTVMLPLDDSQIYCFDPKTQNVLPFELFVDWQGKETLVYSTRLVADGNHPKLLVVKPPREEGSMKVVVDTLW